MIKTYVYKIEGLGTYTIEKHTRNKYILDLTKAGATCYYKGKSHRTLQSAKEEILWVIKKDIEIAYTKYENKLDCLYSLERVLDKETLENYLTVCEK